MKSKRNFRMHQRGFEENSFLSILTYLFLYLILFLIKDESNDHPIFSLGVAISYYILLSLRVLLYIFAPKKALFTNLSIALILMTGLFWPLFLYIEVHAAIPDNQYLIVLPIWIVGITSAASMALFKRYYLLLTFLAEMLILSLIITITNPVEFNFPFALAYILLFGFMSYYSKKNYDMHNQLLNEKKRNEEYAADIAHNKRNLEIANEELQVALERSHEATKAKSEFLANMSHEIRTPMNGIIGVVEILQNNDMSEDNQNLLKIVDESANSLMGLINDILDFSKIEAGKLEISEIEFELSPLIESIVDRFAVKAFDKGIELIFYVDPDVPDKLIGDDKRINQIITNLLGNALKFTESGQVYLHVSLVDSDSNTATVNFSVEDTGIGISPEKISKIFESFTQEDSSTSRRFGGTGLGTTISKMLVELMGGKIWVVSPNTNNKTNQNPGSIFKFNLPLKINNIQKQIREKRMPELDKISLIVLDDNPTNLKIISMNLERWGIKHFTTTSFETAYQYIQKNNPNILLTDFSMPNINGYEVVRKIKNEINPPNLKYILFSSDTINVNRKSANLIGIDDLLYKPLKSSTLYNSILKVMEMEKKMEKKTSRIKIKQIPNAKDFKVLLVEDNLINQKVAHRLFTELGFEIEIAENGKIALEYLLQKSYDIIFMDYQMPVMNGIEATKALRQWKIETPVIALTANAMKGDREKFLDAGMNDYISKPFKIGDLINVLNTYLINRSND